VVSWRAGWPSLQAFTDPRAFWYSAIDMSTSLDQLTADAMKLPVRDRVQLAQRLVSTLDDEVEGDTEALWFAEAERRLEELRSGKVQGVSAEDSFRNAREALKP
jgi:putative addiction module component (TIGR02574 family)